MTGRAAGPADQAITRLKNPATVSKTPFSRRISSSPPSSHCPEQTLHVSMWMLFGWKGVERSEIACPVHRIHGRLDRLIRPPSAREAELIEGGGHLIAMTHPGRVGRFLAERLIQCGGGNPA